jgi:hypothetical protein
MEDPLEEALVNVTKELSAEIIEMHARVDALLSLFVRYAERLGSSGAEIFAEFDKLYEGHYERRLLEVEKHDPTWAALFDRRKIEGLEEDQS